MGTLQLAMEVEKNDWQAAQVILNAIRPATETKALYHFAMESREYADEVFSVVKEGDK